MGDIGRRYRRVLEEVAAACDDVGRDPGDVTVVGVSKYVDAADTAELVRAGCKDLGESRPQVMWAKAESPEIGGVDPVRWHMIGHLQRNKVARTLRYPVVVHSVDSERLLSAIDDSATKAEVAVSVLVEVNPSGDADKTGLSSEDATRLIGSFDSDRVSIDGLMAMAGWGTDVDAARRQFAAVRELRDRIATDARPLRELSMGMSGDFPAAISEGATMVRIGSRLWRDDP